MRKRCKGEKIDLKIEPKLRSLLFLFVFSYQAFAQIPINGFCNYKNFKIPGEYTSLFSVNFNEDKFTDLIIFNNQNKKYISLEAFDKKFEKVRYLESNFEISKLVGITNNDFREKYFSFVSRKNRSTGIISFNKYGKIKIEKIFRFNFYPENLSVADINNDGKSEMLVSGSAFGGLSIISQNWHGLKEKKILSKNTFDEAIFLDLNDDNKADIVAYSSVERSIYFFFNDGSGRLNLLRTFPVPDKIISLKGIDLDSDGFNDIIYSIDNSFKILWGDSVSAYDSVSEIATNKTPSKFILGDYNLDGKIDIAYLDSESSSLSILFSKGNHQFYQEIPYLQKENITDVINYSSTINNGIMALAKDGNMYNISVLNTFEDNSDILIGGTPVTLNYFDYKKDKILDLVFIDSTYNNLNFLVRGNSKKPILFYSYPLFEKHDKIFVDDEDPDIKTFYCYSSSKKVIEVIRYNFKEIGIIRNTLYSPGKILSLNIKKDRKDIDKIYINYLKDGILGLNIIFIQDIRNLTTDYPNLDDSVLASNISSSDALDIYYWQKRNNKLNLKEISMKNVSPLPITKYSLNGNSSVFYFKIDKIINKKYNFESLSLIGNNNRNYFISISKDSLQILYEKNREKLKISNEDIIFTGQWRSNKSDNIFLYSKAKKEIFSINLDLKEKYFEANKVLEKINGYDFFTEYSASFYDNLFYINKNNNTISIKHLNQYENN